MGRMPILFVIDHFRHPNAGTEGQLFQLVTGLDRSRFDPFLLVFSDSEYLRNQNFPCDYELLGRSRLSSPVTWFALWRFARGFKARGGRLAHVFFNDPSLICPPVFWSLGIKTIISRRDMGYWYTAVWRAALIVVGRFVSAVITNSQAVSAVTTENEWLAPKLIHVVYNGYDNRVLPREMPLDLSEFRESHPGAVFVGIVANIRRIKRIHDAIEALSEEKSGPANLHLLVIGDGDSSQLRNQAQSLGVSDRVHFLGKRSDVKACLKALDIALLCSESEGFSNSIVEYMQAGLPIICSDVGGNPEAVTHGATGFLYPCGDVTALGALIKELAESMELRRSIGDQARKVARERFGMEQMIEEHQAIYQRLVEAEGEAVCR